MMAKKNSGVTTVAEIESVKKLPVKQRDYEVGKRKPPKEHQFRPGQSGNPKGPPIRRTQLWVYFCKYMAMTDAKLAKLDRKKLTQAQQTALMLVENAKAGKYSGSERLARHVFDREEGKAVQTQAVNVTGVAGTRELSEAEIREFLQDRRVPCEDAIAT